MTDRRSKCYRPSTMSSDTIKMTRIIKNPSERRKEIISVAKKMFLEGEYDKTTMNDIVNIIGVAKGTVYHYFKSKEELLDAVVESMADDYFLVVKNALGKNVKSTRQRFKKLVEATNVSYQKTDTIKQIHLSGNIVLHVRLLALSIRKIAPLYAEVIEQGCAEGIFKTKYPLEAAELLLAGLQFITDDGFYPWTQQDISRRKKTFSALAEAQLGATKGVLKFLK